MQFCEKNHCSSNKQNLAQIAQKKKSGYMLYLLYKSTALYSSQSELTWWNFVEIFPPKINFTGDGFEAYYLLCIKKAHLVLDFGDDIIRLNFSFFA